MSSIPQTTEPVTTATTDYARLAGLGILAAGVLAAVGWYATARLDSSRVAMLAGIGTSLAASLVGALPIAFTRSGGPGARQVAMMGAMGLRFVVTLALFAVLALTDAAPRGALGLWTGISYVCLLAVETWAAVVIARRRERK